MPRIIPARSTRIAEPICEKIDKLQAEYGSNSFNHMCEMLLAQMIELIDTDPEKRTLPAVCAALDAIRSARPALRTSSRVEQAVASAAAHALAVGKAAKK